MVSFLKRQFLEILKPIGLVFGDIGTSPIYTLSFIFLNVELTRDNIIGVLSLIIYTLVLIAITQYAWLAMSLSRRGEGGEIVLFEILSPLLNSPLKRKFFSVLTYIGVSLLIGDGVITPSISILSSVEGINLIVERPFSCFFLTIIASIITIILFKIQKKGSDRVSKAFGPIMMIWFLVLGTSGIVALFYNPIVLKALNPYYGMSFLFKKGFSGIFILSSVILCTTGVEAIYADMGHLGRRPILKALGFVFVVLVLQYMGQSAFLLMTMDSSNVLFKMILHQAAPLYIPFLILSLMSTVIASQAMISGVFSVVYQGISTKILPIFKVMYTSEKFKSQIYVGAANKFLMFFVLIIIFIFQSSDELCAVYGVGVTGTITITAFIMMTIFYIRHDYVKASCSTILLCIDILFVIANAYKIPKGGYWSLLIGSIPFILILIYSNGQKVLHRSLMKITEDEFLEKFKSAYESNVKIPGTALFCIRTLKFIHPYIIRTMFVNDIIYTDNILLIINKTNEPYGITVNFNTITEGLKVFQIKAGYMEHVNIGELLSSENINEKVIFYGIEDIYTRNKIWKLFSLIKRLTPTFVEFYNLPKNKLHGVTNKAEI